MKAKVVVTLKAGVLDPQGQTIQRSLTKMGHPVTSVRQGKYFELELEVSDPRKVREMVEEISRAVLSNPIIEDFQVEELA